MEKRSWTRVWNIFIILAIVVLLIQSQEYRYTSIKIEGSDQEMTRWTKNNGEEIFLNGKKPNNTDHGTLEIYKRLPDKPYNDPCLMIKTERQQIHITVGDKEFYRYPAAEETTAFWGDIILLPLPKEAVGKEVRVFLKNEFWEPNALIPITYAAIGERISLTNQILLDTIIVGVVGCVLTCLGLYLLCVIYKERRKNIKQKKAQLYLGYWIVTMGIYFLADSTWFYSVVDYPAFGYLLRLFLSCVVPFFIFSFVRCAFPFRHTKPYTMILYAQAIMTTVILTMGLVSKAMLAYGQIIVGVCMAVYSFIAVGVMIVEAVTNPPFRSVCTVGSLLFLMNASNNIGNIMLPRSNDKLFLLLFLLFVFWLIQMVYRKIQCLEKEALEKERLEQQLQQQLKHYEALAELAKQRSILYHDLRHHLQAMQILQTSQKQKETMQYYRQIIEEFNKKGGIMDSHNPVLDAILNEQKRLAEKEGIKCLFDIKIDENLPVRPLDWCAMIGNAMENAIEGCGHFGQRMIRLVMRQQENILCIRVTNTLSISQKEKNDGKPHGLGQQSIRNTAELYAGTVEIRKGHGEYHLEILLTALHHGKDIY